MLTIWVLLLASLVMMAVACALPQWSTGDLASAGLWQGCGRVSTSTAFSCIQLSSPAASDSHLLAARITATWGTVVVLLAFVLSSVSLASRRIVVSQVALALCLTAFVLLCVAYAMWLGEHAAYFGSSSGLRLMLGSSFIMCCVSDGLVLLCVVLFFWDMRLSSREAAKPTDAPDVEDAPGMSGDEGPRVLDTKLDHPSAEETAEEEAVLPPTPDQGATTSPSPLSPASRQLGQYTKPFN
eukprot:TRINITY_DN11421_c0_g1_i1.p1 TRINITY_DN11421_c0_g1~~TRINITY_DN11421_c0_g1_i1.p1  ORF type:complete len:257 (+),score=52.27 TRINITY_DN11421_c0_g1_i1:52-771(+)